MVYVPNENKKNDTNRNNSSGELICSMTDSDDPENHNGHNTFQAYVDNGDRYHWSQTLQGIILSSYFIGCIVSQIPGGILVQKMGAKWIYSTIIFSSAITIALIPLAVQYGNRIELKEMYHFDWPIVDCFNRWGHWINSSTCTGWVSTRTNHSSRFCIYITMVFDWRAWTSRFSSFYGHQCKICLKPTKWTKNSLKIWLFQIGGILSAYVVGNVVDASARWDAIFYGLALITAITGILFVRIDFDR